MFFALLRTACGSFASLKDFEADDPSAARGIDTIMVGTVVLGVPNSGVERRTDDARGAPGTGGVGRRLC